MLRVTSLARPGCFETPCIFVLKAFYYSFPLHKERRELFLSSFRRCDKINSRLYVMLMTGIGGARLYHKKPIMLQVNIELWISAASYYEEGYFILRKILT